MAQDVQVCPAARSQLDEMRRGSVYRPDDYHPAGLIIIAWPARDGATGRSPATPGTRTCHDNRQNTTGDPTRWTEKNGRSSPTPSGNAFPSERPCVCHICHIKWFTDLMIRNQTLISMRLFKL